MSKGANAICRSAITAAATVLFVWAMPGAAISQTAEVQTIETPNNPYLVIIDDRKPEERTVYMPYTPTFVRIAGSDTVWIAGATAFPLYHKHPHDPKDVAALPDAYNQTRLTIENITRQLKSVGAEWTDVVHCTSYVANLPANIQGVQRALREFMSPYFKHPQGLGSPGGALLGVQTLIDKETIIEMACHAVLPPSRRIAAVQKVAPK